MDLQIGSLSPSPEPTAPPAEQKNRRLDQAATDFEGLLISQMLRHARQAGDGGWLGTGEDKSSETMTELAEESLARMMASRGCLGLASIMKQGVLNEAMPKQANVPRAEGGVDAPR